MSYRALSIVGVLVAAALFLAVNILAGATLRTARVDLTENRLYTLTSGSRSIARGTTEPIRLRLYFTNKAANALPAFKSHATRVRELLEEYALLSAGRIQVEVIDPEPYSEAEDQAVAAGLTGVPTGTDRLYFGLVGTNSTDDQEVIPFLDPQKETFLEYDVSRMIYLLSNPGKKVVGVMSALPLEGEQFDPMTGQPGRLPPWQIIVQMRQFFDVRMIDPIEPTIDEDVDVLMVVHPKGFSDAALYAIDQYVLRGGRLLAFVDPNCEVDAPPAMDLQARIRHNKGSDLRKLFDAWGLEMVESRVAGDLNAAVRVNASGNPNRPEAVNFVVWMRLTPDNFDTRDAVVGQFQQVIMATPGVLRRKSGEGANPDLVFSPLIQTGTESMLIEQSRVQFIPEPKAILADFKSGGERLTLAARLGGNVPTAFPGGDPARPEGAEAKTHLARSTRPVNVLVFADVDVAADRFWIQEERLMGQIVLGYRKIADNGDMVLSALDNLTGSGDLISVRARGQYSRPFTKVAEIQKEAERKYLAEQQRLEQEIRSAEQRIAELQRQRPDQAMQTGQILLTPEQQAEIDRLQQEILKSRKQKRQVEHDMRKDIERLGTRLKVINTAAIPVVVCVLALGLGMYRSSRRRADRARLSKAAA